MNLKTCSFFLLHESEKMALFFHPSKSSVGNQTRSSGAIYHCMMQLKNVAAGTRATTIDGVTWSSLVADRRLGWMKKQRHFFAFMQEKK